MLFKTKVDFGISENSSVTNPVPTLREWQELWKVWTLVTRTVVPKESFLSAPSSLRQPYIFYLGHIPASLDIHLAKVTGEALNQPASYARIFGQGIGPDVDDPSRCHDHSKVPSVWPQLGEIEAYEQQVRKRLEALYEKNVAIKLPKVDAALRIEFEHQALHLETILYGVVQSDVINPPPGLIRPDFEQIAEFAKSKWTSNEWCSIPRAELAIGLETDGAEQNMNGSLDSGIVKHVRTVTIGAFEAKAYPITISEYVDYLIDTGDSRLPACWIDHIPEESAESPSKFSTNGHVNGYAHSNGAVSAVTSFVEGKAIRTLWGPVPLKYALQWPAFASYDDLSACAHWLGGRIPSEDEARSIYRHAKLLRRDDADNAIGAKIPAVNAYVFLPMKLYYGLTLMTAI